MTTLHPSWRSRSEVLWEQQPFLHHRKKEEQLKTNSIDKGHSPLVLQNSACSCWGVQSEHYKGVDFNICRTKRGDNGINHIRGCKSRVRKRLAAQFIQAEKISTLHDEIAFPVVDLIFTCLNLLKHIIVGLELEDDLGMVEGLMTGTKVSGMESKLGPAEGATDGCKLGASDG